MEVFVARQPIFDIQKEVVAYELLFRNGVQNVFPEGACGDTATRSLISSSVMSIGFESLTGGKRAFINFTGGNLENGLAQLVPKQFLAVEILETVEPTAEVVDACRELKKHGYQIVLDDFVFDPRFRPFIELADIIKIDFVQTKTREERERLRQLIPQQVELLAEKVETEEDFAEGVELGYKYFQGYFFSKPVVIRRKEISPNRLMQIQLVQEVNRDDVDASKLENIIKRDVSLSYKLFKYMNSAYFGVRNEIKSIRQAIVLLGSREIRRWVALVTIKDMSQDKPAELLNTAIVRGRLCELVAQASGKSQLEQSAFVIGLFSLLDALLDRSMEDILSEMSMSPEVVKALTGADTPLGLLLRLAAAYERADWELVGQECKALGIREEIMPGLYNQAIQWAEKLRR